MTDDDSAPRVGDHRPRGVRAAWLLVAVAAVPLLGLATVTSAAVSDASELQRAVARTEEVAEQASALTNLHGVLFDEMTWAAVSDISATIDAPRSALESVFGVDPTTELARSQPVTDAVLGSIDDAELAAELDVFGSRLADLRANGRGLGELLVGYSEVRAGVRDLLIGRLVELTSPDNPAANSPELRRSVRILEHGITIRSLVSDAYFQYFASQFEVRDPPGVELARLIRTRADWDTTLAELETATADDVDLSAELFFVMSDPDMAAFITSIDELIARSLRDGVSEAGVPIELGTVAADIDGVSAAYRAAGSATEVTQQLFEVSTDRVLMATAEISESSRRDAVRAYALAGVLGLATLLAALAASQFIVRPLKQLRRAADRLNADDADDTDDTSDRDGGAAPVEIRAAARALDDAARRFSLVEAQARALAAGNLDSEILDAGAPGGLAASLQSAVARLRSALGQQEEFRRRLAHEASHDGLTQIPNRNASMAQLTRSLARTARADSQLAVLFIDLDHFKDVNDVHGHQAGDTVLVEFTRRLVASVREGDYVGRLGGDEFIVVAEPVRGVHDAVELAERLVTAIERPIDLGDTTIVVGASIGVAVAERSQLTADELLRDADLAVYRAKQVGRGRIEICDEDLRQQMSDSADLAEALDRAVELDEFRIHYQPIVRCRDAGVQAYEALVRWQRPGHDRLLTPAAFIEFAERSQQIVDIDRWVIDAVARQLAAWQFDPDTAGVPVAVNVSGRHLAHDDVVGHILEPLERHGVDPRMLIVELTESAVLDDIRSAATKLRILRESGVRIAIDDFGTGYTGLAHLRILPVDILKIDRTFTANAAADEHEASIVKLIIDTGHILGATITAEGIETVQESDRLTELGADSLQGYFFARPMPADAMVALPPAPEATSQIAS